MSSDLPQSGYLFIYLWKAYTLAPSTTQGHLRAFPQSGVLWTTPFCFSQIWSCVVGIHHFKTKALAVDLVARKRLWTRTRCVEQSPPDGIHHFKTKSLAVDLVSGKRLWTRRRCVERSPPDGIYHFKTKALAVDLDLVHASVFGPEHVQCVKRSPPARSSVDNTVLFFTLIGP